MIKLFHILVYKFIGFIKFERNNSFLKIIQNIGAVAVYSAFGIGAYLFSIEIIEFLLEKIKIGDFLLHQFMAIILFIFFISVNVGNIIVSYSTLFKSSEVSYFFTKPVPPTKIFLIKFLDNFFYSSGTLIMVLIALFLGYSTYYSPNIFELAIILVFNFFPYLISAAALGAIILLIIMKLSIYLGLRNILLGLVIIYLGSVISFFNINTPIDLVNNVMKHYPNVDYYFGSLLSDIVKFLPNNWIAESFYWMLRGKFELSLQYTILQISLSLFLLLTALFLGSIWYSDIWLSAPSFRKKNKTKKINRWFEKDSFISSSFEVILKKDFLLFIREPSQMIHAFVLIFLILLFAGSIKSVSLIGESNIELQTILYLVVYLFNVLFISTLSLRFVFPLISLEGKAFWKIKTSPISTKKYLASRLLPILIPIILMGQTISYFSSRSSTSELVQFAAVLTFFVSVALVYLNFGMGGLFAVYKEKNPIRIASSQGASLSFLLSLVYMVFIVVVIFSPISNYFAKYRGIVKETDIYYSFNTALIVIGSVSIIISALYYSLLIKALKRDY